MKPARGLAVRFAAGLIILLGTLAAQPQPAWCQANSLLQAAKQGSAHAQAELGERFLQLENPTAALPWLQAAAVQNHPQAQYYLGQVLLADVQNTQEAQLAAEVAEGLRWLLRAAQNQHAPAQLLYAQLVLGSPQGQPMQHSPGPALELLLQCAQAAPPYPPCVLYAYTAFASYAAFAALSKSETESPAPPTHPLSALPAENSSTILATLPTLLRPAARLGHPQASLDLAMQALNFETTLEADDPPLLKLLSTAAQGGLAKAQRVLGQGLMDGTRLPKNPALGALWLSKAAAQTQSTIELDP